MSIALGSSLLQCSFFGLCGISLDSATFFLCAESNFFMTTNVRLLVLCFAALLNLGTLGCGSGANVAQVTGVVTLADGKPLDLIHVEFWSDNGPRSWGKTDSNGKFTLKLDDESPVDGAVIGKHKVLLRDTWPSKDDKLGDGGDWVDNSNGKKSRIHSKYYDVVKSPISFEVKSGEKNVCEIKLDPPGK